MVRAPAAPAQQTSVQLHLDVNIIKEFRLIIAPQKNGQANFG